MSRAIVPNRTGLARDDAALRQQHERFEEGFRKAIRDGTPLNTVLAYERDVADFEKWCNAQPVPERAVPAEEMTIIGYIESLDEQKITSTDGVRYRYKSGTISRRVSGIVWAHALANIASPVTPRISKMLHAIRVRRSKPGDKEIGERQTKMAAPLLLDDLAKISSWAQARKHPLATRNLALVLVGWSCAMRRSEIADLQIDDISALSEEGFLLTIGHSKADQTGEGVRLPVSAEDDPDLCPVRALQQWLDVRGAHEGPLFPGNGWGKRMRRLSDKQVNRIVISCARDAGASPSFKNTDFSAHSLRAGLITEAVRAGQSDHDVMARSRHKTHQVFMRYVRLDQTVKKNVVTGYSKWRRKT